MLCLRFALSVQLYLQQREQARGHLSYPPFGATRHLKNNRFLARSEMRCLRAMRAGPGQALRFHCVSASCKAPAKLRFESCVLAACLLQLAQSPLRVCASSGARVCAVAMSSASLAKSPRYFLRPEHGQMFLFDSLRAQHVALACLAGVG